MAEIKQNLVDKSVEAFIMGLEIYNKPTIKYRIEGFRRTHLCRYRILFELSVALLYKQQRRTLYRNG